MQMSGIIDCEGINLKAVEKRKISQYIKNRSLAGRHKRENNYKLVITD